KPVIDLIKIDRLGLSRLAAGVGQFPAVDQAVDQGRLSHVGTPGQSDLGQGVPGILIGLHRAPDIFSFDSAHRNSPSPAPVEALHPYVSPGRRSNPCGRSWESPPDPSCFRWE